MKYLKINDQKYYPKNGESINEEDLLELVGNDISTVLGVKHYEPPAPQDLSAKGRMPYQIPKTDEERWENLVDTGKLPFGEEVDITLKIDGQSCLSEETIVETNLGKTTIKEVCENDKHTHILSFNENTGISEMKEITHRMIQDISDDWFEIEIEDGTTLKITGNHKVYLPELKCYRRIDELNGDEKFLLI